MQIERWLPEESDWAAFVRDVAPLIQAGTWLRLKGDLGAGKTTFVRYLLRHWGYTDVVASPSFPLLIEYPFEDLVVYHLDAFRLKPDHPQEWDLEAWRAGVLLAEWPENTHLKPQEFQFELEILPQERGRQIIWRACQ